MKTLIIIGVARKNGYTHQMADLFLEYLDGEKEIINTYRMEIKPYVDRRFCRKEKECIIKDSMQEVYQKLEEADNITLASPMYLHSIIRRMKSLTDRFQVYWASYVRNDIPGAFLRKSVMLMVGGAPSFENQSLGGEIVLKNPLNDPSIECLGQACLSNSDRDGLEIRPNIMTQVIASTEKMNRAVK